MKSKNLKNYIIKIILDWIRPKSPCCNKPMKSIFEMELDKLLYKCHKCSKEWF